MARRWLVAWSLALVIVLAAAASFEAHLRALRYVPAAMVVV